MTDGKRKVKVAVIGAGWVGIGCMRSLTLAGHEVGIYEARNDLGGTWHPDNCYAGLRTHATAITVEFHDFPLPEHIDRFGRMPSCEVYHYLKAFCRHFDLEKNIRCNTTVKSVNFNSHSKKSNLLLIDTYGREQLSGDYDYVIYTHGFTARELPNFSGKESFEGDIYHSFDVSEDILKKIVDENKKVVVIGGSKTGTDFILKFHELCYKVSWLVRKPYYFLSYDLFKAIREADAEGRISHPLRRLAFQLSIILMPFNVVLAMSIWKFFGIIHTYGKKSDFKRFHYGYLDRCQIKILKTYYQKNAIKGELKKLTPKGLIASNDKEVNADVIICCTGSGAANVAKILTVTTDNVKLDLEKLTTIYRSRVIPEVPNLIFTSFHNFVLGTVNGRMQGDWICNYINLNPSKNYLLSHATKHRYPFFSKNPIFDSNCYITEEVLLRTKPFFGNEINRNKFFKWLTIFWFSGKPRVPFQFDSFDVET